MPGSAPTGQTCPLSVAQGGPRGWDGGLVAQVVAVPITAMAWGGGGNMAGEGHAVGLFKASQVGD